MSSQNTDRKKYKSKESSKHRIWELFSESILPPLIRWSIQLANIVQTVGANKLATFSAQVEMNCWMALNCETEESGFCLHCCVWLVMESERVTTWLSASVSFIPILNSDELQKVRTSSHSGHVYAKTRRATEACEWKHSQTSFTLTGLLNYPSEILVAPISTQDVWQIFASCAVVHVSCQSPLIMFLPAVPTSPSLPPRN